MLARQSLMTSRRTNSPWDEWDGTNDGSLATIYAASCDYFDVCRLSSTAVFVGYQKQTSAYDTFGVVLSVSGTTITVNAAATGRYGKMPAGVRVCRLTESKALILYSIDVTGFGGFNIEAKVATITGTTVSFGSALTVEEAGASFLAITGLDDDTAVAMVDNNAYVLSVSGTDVSKGDATAVEASGSMRGIDLCRLTSSTAMVVYYMYTGANPCYARVLSVSGDSVSAGSACNYAAVSNGYQRVDALLETRAVVTNIKSTSVAEAYVLSVPTTTVSVGSAYTFETNQANGYGADVARLSASRAMILWGDATDTSAEARVARVSGSSIAYEDAVTIDSDQAEHCCIQPLADDSAAIAVFQDLGTNYLVAMVLAV